MLYNNKNNENGMSNQEQKDFGFLDALTITSFLAQIDNINKDSKQTDWIHKVIKAIGNEIQKLHKENELLRKNEDKIIKLLEEIKNEINR